MNGGTLVALRPVAALGIKDLPVQFEFPAGTPAPSIVRDQGGPVTTATRVP